VSAIVGTRSLGGLTVGITAGASTPERIIREVIQAMTEQEVMQNQQEDQKEIQPAAMQQEEIQETQAAVTAVEAADTAVEAADTAAAAETAPVPEAIPEAPQPVRSDVRKESPLDQADVSFTDFIDNIPHLKRGVTVRGTIIRCDNENVYVDVRDKSEGRIPRHEFEGDPDFDLDQAVREHMELDVYVRNIRNSDLGKEIILSKARVDFTKYKGLLEEAYTEKQPISVKVVNIVKDGVIASYGGVDIYIHRTQLEMGIVNDLEPYRNQTLDILVTQFDPDKKRLRVSGSRRALLALERRSKADELWQTIEIGLEYDGVVRSLTDFGAFVDIGGVDGLVHVSELSWNRIRHPSEVVSVGDQIHVYVKDFDPERKRISLGYKKTVDDPYHDVEMRFPVGSIVHGTVVRMFPFGAFVEIAPGVDALCHISQIANVRLTKPNEVLSEGMEVDARVLEVSNEARRVSISIKEVEPINPPGYEDSHF
jgi:4-hydroxy-3-methylbut-2-enyl diphosphate reductase